ncbi:MAG: hypothetical protein K2Y27_02335 [Xanthobacteraceae bacterium]|nr:hypothetical protein [Xanthobacteraceae bacterium]
MLGRRTFLATGIAAGASAAVAERARSHPSRQIRMIVPFAAGGPVDTMARLVGEPLGMIIGAPIISENRGGASGASSRSSSPVPIRTAIRCSAAASARSSSNRS